MLNWAIYLAVFFITISYAIHLLKQKQVPQSKPQRTQSTGDDSSSTVIASLGRDDSSHSHHHHGGHDHGSSHSGFDGGHHGGFDGGGHH